MGKAAIWVHRRHLDYPSVNLGLQHVEQEVAAALFAADCAQDWQTDQRKLISPSVSQPPVPKTGAKPRRGRSRKAPVESTPPSEDQEIEPSAADVDEAPRYRRRDMRAEK